MRELENFREGAEVETVGTNYLESAVRGLIRKYYQERMDNMVLAFGKAGDRIIRNIKPLQIRRTSYRSIQAKEERAFASVNGETESTEIEIAEPDPVKVMLLSKEEYEYRKNLNQFEQWNDTLETASISTSFFDAGEDYDAMSKELLNAIDKSNSFVLVSGFGGSFAQNMHIGFSKLLTRRKIAHINVIIKPSREDSKRRKIAEAGIKELEASGANVVVYDNQKLVEKQRVMIKERTRVIRKINIDIARQVEVFSARLSNASELLKYQLTA